MKTKYQPERVTPSWEASIRVQRKHVKKFLAQSPSLRQDLAELLEDAAELLEDVYDNARIDAADETGLELDVFPEVCEWRVGDVIE